MNLTSLVAILLVMGIVRAIADLFFFEKKRRRRKKHYQENVLTSGLWKRKRSLVLKRDGRRCVYCGQRATQVHHKQYAKVNIGREPIEWLVSVCPRCHAERHGR